ncbi:MAG TPA: hypothetical protein G4O04_10605, partial [Anaerolineae bacterium]|nr:hypothetical protein [Anaerolineae bacterium]
LLDVPVVSQLIRRFNITLNIHRAEIGLESGWIEARLSGDQAEIDAALAWLKERGLQIDPIEE